MAFSGIRSVHSNNVSSLRRSPWAEISGSLGDLGTLLPLMIALALQNSISLSTTLVFSGLWNLLTGIIFGIPLPVQPMKAIAAVAISRSFSMSETVSAGFFVSRVVLLFSITGLLQWFSHTIPIPVIKGIQVGAGLSLVLSAGSSLLQPLGWITPNWSDNLLWALFAFLVLILTQKSWRFPYAIVMFILAVVFSLCVSENLPSLTIWRPQVMVPAWTDFKVGAVDAGLGQLPLTTLNSIIAVTYLSADLLPHLPAPSVTAMGISVATMNLIGGWFGAMPVCHGSGGLAAQYRFGARSGSSIIILGIFKIILGLVFGESLVGLLGNYPKSLLGIMVIAAGLELSKVGESLNHGARDLWEAADLGSATEIGEGGLFKRQRSLSDAERAERWSVMMMTVAGLLAFRNDGVGFATGMMCHWAYRCSSTINKWGGLRWAQHSWISRNKSNMPRASSGVEEEQLLSQPDNSPIG